MRHKAKHRTAIISRNTLDIDVQTGARTNSPPGRMRMTSFSVNLILGSNHVTFPKNHRTQEKQEFHEDFRDILFTPFPDPAREAQTPRASSSRTTARCGRCRWRPLVGPPWQTRDGAEAFIVGDRELGTGSRPKHGVPKLGIVCGTFWGAARFHCLGFFVPFHTGDLFTKLPSPISGFCRWAKDGGAFRTL